MLQHFQLIQVTQEDQVGLFLLLHQFHHLVLEFLGFQENLMVQVNPYLREIHEIQEDLVDLVAQKVQVPQEHHGVQDLL